MSPFDIFKLYGYSSVASNPSDDEMVQIDWELPEGKKGDDYKFYRSKKCTCGTHRTYGEMFPFHSDWCDLYEKPR